MNKREARDELKVVIIGAGISGLSAAITLYRSGLKNIAILEADAEAGGRIKSVPFGGGFVDLGAQWFHGTENELCQIAKENGFLQSVNSYEGQGNYFTHCGKIVADKVVSDVASVVEKSLNNLENASFEITLPESVEKYLTQQFEIHIESSDDPEEIKCLKRQVFDWHLRFQVIDNACTDLKTLSAKYFGQYKFCGGDDLVNLKHGFSSIIEHLVSELPQGVLCTKCPVKTIKWHQRKSSPFKNVCVIVTEQGDTYVSEHVIITCSVGFLKENWSMFDPPLPMKYLEGFQCIGFDTMNKVYLEYDHCWWGNAKGIQFVWNSDKRKRMLRKDPMLWTCDLTGFDTVVGLPNVLLGWVGGEGALLLEKLSSDVIGKHCGHLLREITGDNRIPDPRSCISSCWHSNKYIKGGYSHLNTNIEKYESMIASLSEPVYSSSTDSSKHSALLFAGEALHKTYYSTAHGAFESGKQQAMKLIDLINLSDI